MPPFRPMSNTPKDQPNPPDPPHPDIDDITEAYAHLATVMYQSSMGYADLPVQVHHAHGILRRELTRLDALPTCDPTILVPPRPELCEPLSGDE